MTEPNILTQPVLALDGVVKVFGDFVALDKVSVPLAAGQVHALLGANGSGKSTLVKIMSGVLQPDGGQLDFLGTPLAGFGSPAGAAGRGVRVVHQEAPFIDSLSVAETVAFARGFGTPTVGRIPWRRLRRDVAALLEENDVAVSPSQLCATLTPADRAGLSLAIVMAGQSAPAGGPDAAGDQVRLLIVDEVTAAIPEAEASRHLARLRAVADRGVAVVMVTHRLAELEIADDVTVLRAGKVVYREDGGGRLPAAELVARMVGPGAQQAARRGAPGAAPASRPVQSLWKSTPAVSRGKVDQADAGAAPASRGPAIEASELTGEQLSGLSFSAVAGEVVGFAGLRLSGVEELPRILAGGSRRTGGSLSVAGHPIKRDAGPAAMVAAGIGAIPADRLHDGGVASLSVEENFILPTLGAYWHRPARRRAAVKGVIEAFDVRPPRPSALFGSLSGGNQQKVLLGKWLALRPAVLVLDDPTYGVDPAARETIFDAIVDAAALGISVLFFSTEPEQLVRVCSRVIVLRDGRPLTELTGTELTLENLIAWSYQ
jgi:ribose transport system ATP-binding protein